MGVRRWKATTLNNRPPVAAHRGEMSFPRKGLTILTAKPTIAKTMRPSPTIFINPREKKGKAFTMYLSHVSIHTFWVMRHVKNCHGPQSTRTMTTGYQKDGRARRRRRRVKSRAMGGTSARLSP